MKNLKKLISSTNPLTPILTVDTKTGEVLTGEEANKSITSLIKYVQEETKHLYYTHKEGFCEEIKQAKTIGSPNSFARQRGYSSSYKELPSEVLAKSRINELILHKFTSEVSGFVFNPNPRKQNPSFSPKINLGAVDKQMASLSFNAETQKLTLMWKCWDVSLLMEFWIPKNFLSKNIKKWSLPTVQIEKGKPVFRFTVEESYTLKKKTHSTEHAGVDLGRKEPYVLVITNNKGQRKAHYTASKGLVRLNNKRERLIKEKKHLSAKTHQYKQLGLDPTILEQETQHVKNKATRLGVVIAQRIGSEIANKIQKHSTGTLNVEDLSWVHGVRYGSRWNHSVQQASIKQATLRKGIRIQKINPKNTSNTCSRCGLVVVHNARKRTVYCGDCKTNLDRDYNAALNIALKTCPNYTSMIGNNYSSPEQVIVSNHSLKNTILRTPT